MGKHFYHFTINSASLTEQSQGIESHIDFSRKSTISPLQLDTLYNFNMLFRPVLASSLGIGDVWASVRSVRHDHFMMRLQNYKKGRHPS